MFAFVNLLPKSLNLSIHKSDFSTRNIEEIRGKKKIQQAAFPMESWFIAILTATMMRKQQLAMDLGLLTESESLSQVCSNFNKNYQVFHLREISYVIII